MKKERATRDERRNETIGSRHKKTVLVSGTFDILHDGHRYVFREAATYGDVVVIVARDTSVVRMKRAPAHHTERSRLARVAREPDVSRALLGDHDDFLAPVVRIRPDVIVLGYDQRTFDITTLKQKLKARGLTPTIIRLRAYRPTTFKSSIIKARSATEKR